MTNQKLLCEIYNKPQVPLYVLLNVNATQYFSISVKELHLTCRATNCCLRSGCYSLGDLLGHSVEEITHWRNAGNATVHEIIDVVCNSCRPSAADSAEIDYKECCLDLLRTLQERVANTLADDELKQIAVELISILPSNHPKAQQYRNALTASLPSDTFISKSHEDFIDIPIIQIPDNLQALPLAPFWNEFKAFSGNDLDSIDIDSLWKLSDSAKLFENATLLQKHIIQNDFIPWITMDINNTLTSIFHVAESGSEMMPLAQQKMTLESIGNQFGVSKERVRQKLDRLATHILNMINQHRCFEWIHAYYNNSGCLLINDLGVLSEENRGSLRFVMERASDVLPSSVSYYSEYDALSFSKESTAAVLSNLVLQLPTMANDETMDTYILDLQERHPDFDIKLFVMELNAQYEHYTDLYVRNGSMSKQDKVAYVLEKEYPDGIVLGNDAEMDGFAKRLETIFYIKPTDISIEYIKNIIRQCSYQSDEGVYKHVKNLSVGSDTLNIISTFIEDEFATGRTALGFTEIFLRLKNQLEDKGIPNQYVLRSVIATLLPSSYYISKTCVAVNEEASLDNDFCAFIRANYPIQASKVAQHFTMDLEQVYQIVAKTPALRMKGPMIFYTGK